MPPRRCVCLVSSSLLLAQNDKLRDRAITVR